MSTDQLPDELVDHLCRHSTLDASEATRLVIEVLAFHHEAPADFIRRRHHELQKTGLNNSTIYQRLQEELASYRFTAEPMTERQIRRTIYG